MTRCLFAATLCMAVICGAPAALAAPPACGTYVDADSGARLEIDDREQARLLREGMAPAAQHYRVTGTTLRLFNTDEGYASDYTLDRDGRTLTEVEQAFRKTFVLQTPRACARPPPRWGRRWRRRVARHPAARRRPSRPAGRARSA